MIRIIGQVSQIALNFAAFRKIHRVKLQFLVCALSGNGISSKRNGGGKYMAAIVIGVFTDQIDAARCKKETRLSRGCSKDFMERPRQVMLIHDIPPILYKLI